MVSNPMIWSPLITYGFLDVLFQVSKETLIAAFNLSQADDLVEKTWNNWDN
jgi:hypothetical protein